MFQVCFILKQIFWELLAWFANKGMVRVSQGMVRVNQGMVRVNQGDRKGRPYNDYEVLAYQYLCANMLIHGVMMPPLSYSLGDGVERNNSGCRNVT